MADIVQDIVVGGMKVASVSVCIREAIDSPNNPSDPDDPIIVEPVDPLPPEEPEEPLPPDEPVEPDVPSVISAKAGKSPWLKPIKSGDQIGPAFVLGEYESTGGAIADQSHVFLVNNFEQPETYIAQRDDSVVVKETVVDASNESAVFTTPAMVVEDPVIIPTSKTVTYFSASCSKQGTNSPVWDWVLPRVRNGELVNRVIFMGDIHYFNTTSQTAFNAAKSGKQGDVIAEANAWVTPSDHDWLGNNSHGSSTSPATSETPGVTRDPAVRLWRSNFPYIPWALSGETDQLYYKIDDDTIPLRTIITDCRTRKINYTVMWSAPQLQWIKDQFLDAKNKGLFVRLVIDVPPKGGEASTAELNNIGAYILSIGMENQFELLCGDQHCIAFDSGANYIFGGCRFPLVSGGTVRSSQSVKQRPHDGGEYWASTGDGAYSQGIFSEMTWDGANSLRIKHRAFAGKADIDAATGKPKMRILKDYERVLTRNGVFVDPKPKPPTIPAFDADLLVSQMGINIHLYAGEFWGQTQAWEKYLFESGFRNVRTSIGTNGTLRDHLLRLLDMGGMKALLLGSPVGPTAVAAVQYLQNADFTGLLLGIEGKNEWNYGSPNYDNPNWIAEVKQAQLDIFRTANQHALTDSVPIIGPSLWKRTLTDINALGNLAPESEAASIHYYNGNRPPSTGLLGDGNLQPMETVIAALEKNSIGNPFWVTECGYNVSSPSVPVSQWVTSPEDAAVYLLREVLLFFMLGAEKVFPYALVDSQTSGNRYGLVELIGSGATASFRPRPAYYAMQRLIQRMSGVGPVLIPSGIEFTIPQQPTFVKTMQMQKKDRSRIIAIWQELPINASNTPKALTINFPEDRTVTVYEPNISPTGKLAGRGKTFAINVPTHVMLLEVV